MLATAFSLQTRKVIPEHDAISSAKNVADTVSCTSLSSGISEGQGGGCEGYFLLIVDLLQSRKSIEKKRNEEIDIFTQEWRFHPNKLPKYVRNLEASTSLGL